MIIFAVLVLCVIEHCDLFGRPLHTAEEKKKKQYTKKNIINSTELGISLNFCNQCSECGLCYQPPETFKIAAKP